MHARTHGKGFTIIELLVAIGIGLMVSTVTVLAFQNFRDYFAFRAVVGDIQTSLIDARAATLAAKNDTVHGVHIESTKVVRFTGGSYVAGATTNIEFPFLGRVSASATLAGGGSDVVFTRLTGTTAQSGTIVVTEPRSGKTATITLFATGLVQL